MRFRIANRFLMLSAIVSLALIGSGSRTAHAAEWTIAPYLWGSGVQLDLNLNSQPVLGADVPLSDLVDKLDMAFMGHFEGRGENWGGFIDVIYLDLSDSKTITIPPGTPVSGDLSLDTGLTIGMYELGGLYRIGRPAPGTAEFDILFGVRQIDMDQVINTVLPGPGMTPVNAELNVSETDVFAGGRVLGQFTEKWNYIIRADLGGGGTDGVFNLYGAVGYTFGQTGLFTMNLGYRYMTIKMGGDLSGIPAETDIRMSGPVLGFIFNF